MNLFVGGIRNLFYVFASQSISLFFSLAMALLVPKALGIKEYGYWQIFFFYGSYAGFFQFGFNDGIYLRYGGKEYSSLDRPLFRSQLRILAGSQLAISLLLIISIWAFEPDKSRAFALIFAAFCIFIMGTTTFYLLIDQSTNRIRIYSKGIIIDKVVFLILVVAFYMLSIRNFEIFIIGNMFSKLIGFSYFILTSKEITFGPIDKSTKSLEEAKNNIRAGIKLMLANIAGMLMVGVGRIFIDLDMGVEAFGIFSLAMSATSLVLLLISSISIVLYPILRQCDSEDLPRYFVSFNCMLMTLIGCALLLYLPAQLVITMWLPKYGQVLSYLFLLFPISIYQGKMQIIVNTYYKTMREEKAMMIANISAVLVCVLLTAIFYQVHRSILSIIFAMIIASAWRCYASEYYLKRKMGIRGMTNVFYENGLVILFILSIWLFGGLKGSGIYLVGLIIFVMLNKVELRRIIRILLLSLGELRRNPRAA